MNDQCCVCGRVMPRHRRAKKKACGRRCASVQKWAQRQARIREGTPRRRRIVDGWRQ